MNSKLIRNVIFSLILLNSSVLIGQEESQAPQVAILGVFHFGATSDMASINMENTLGEQRQKEIKELVAKLEEYKPTKILLEYPYSHNENLNKDYANYLSGQSELKVNESNQIGFRLAKASGHTRIFGVDYKLDMPFEAVQKYCEENDEMEKFGSFVQGIMEYTASETKSLATKSLTEYFADMNSDKFDLIVNRLYLQDVLEFGDSENEVGVSATAVWLERNLIILNNIDRVIEDNNDRVLVIIGQAHRAILKDYIKNRDDMNYIEIGDYLKLDN